MIEELTQVPINYDHEMRYMKNKTLEILMRASSTTCPNIKKARQKASQLEQSSNPFKKFRGYYATEHVRSCEARLIAGTNETQHLLDSLHRYSLSATEMASSHDE